MLSFCFNLFQTLVNMDGSGKHVVAVLLLYFIVLCLSVNMIPVFAITLPWEMGQRFCERACAPRTPSLFH